MTCPNLPKIAQTPHLPIFAQDCLDCVCVASAEPGGPGPEPTDPAFSGDPSKHTTLTTHDDHHRNPNDNDRDDLVGQLMIN